MRLRLIPLILLGFLAGCTASEATSPPLILPTLIPTEIPQAQIPIPTQESIPIEPTLSIIDEPVIVPDACSHLLLPLHEGISWTYILSSNGIEQPLTFDSQLGGIDLTFLGQSAHLNCNDGGLSGLPPGLVGHPDLGNLIAGTNPRGNYLPAPADLLPLGTPLIWDMEVVAGGLITLPGIAEPIAITGGRIVFFSSTGEMASITLLNETLTALTIQDTVFFHITVQQPDGSEQSITINTFVRRYYSENIGLVRMIFDGGTVSMASGGGASELSSGIELNLISYSR